MRQRLSALQTLIARRMHGKGRLCLGIAGACTALVATLVFAGPTGTGLALDGVVGIQEASEQKAEQPVQEEETLQQKTATDEKASSETSDTSDESTGSNEGNAGQDDSDNEAAEEQSVVVTFPENQSLEIPYGVNVAEWLSKHTHFVVDGKTVSASDFSKQYFGGKDVFVTADNAQTYPANAADGTPIDWSAYIAFAQPAAGSKDDSAPTLELPDLSGLKASMSWTNTGDPADVAVLPQAPEAAFATLKGARANGENAALVQTGTWAESSLRLWLAAADVADGATPVTLSFAGDAISALSSTFTLNVDGSFNNTDAVKVGTSRTVYARLGKDVKVRTANGEEMTLYKGQLVTIPCAVDTSAPTLSQLEVRSPSGEVADFSQEGVVNNGVVTATSSGVVLRVAIADPDPAEGSQEYASTIDPQSIVLTLGDTHIKPSSYSRDVASFKLSLDTLGEGVWQLSDMQISAADYAGNTASLTVGGQEPFITSGVTALEIFNEKSEANQAQVAVVLNGKALADGETYVSNAAVGVPLSFQVTDKNFESTSSYDDLAYWKDHLVAGANTSDAQTDLFYENFSAVPHTQTWRTQSAQLAGEGTHRLTFTYRGKRVLFGWIVLERSTSCTVVIDATNPVVTDATIEGRDTIDESREVATIGNTTYLVGGKRTIRVRLQDLLNGSPDGASGIDPKSIKVTVAREQDLSGTPGITNEYTTEDEGGLTLTKDGWIEIPLSGEGLYKLSDIQLTFADVAGNTVQNRSLATIVDELIDKRAWVTSSGDAIKGFVVDDPATNPASVHITLTEPDNAPVSLQHGTYRDDVEAQLTIADPWFEVYRSTRFGSQAAVLAGTLDPGSEGLDAPAEQLSSPSLAEFIDEDNDNSWTHTVVLPTDVAGKVVEGDYALTLTYEGLVGKDDPATHEVKFRVDRTAPQLTAASLTDLVDPAKDLAVMDDGSSYLVGTGRTIRVRVQDLLRGEQPSTQADDADKRDQAHTAGVDVDSVRVHLTRADGMTSPDDPLNPSHFTTETRELTPDESGWITIELSDEGLYRLDGIIFDLPDNAGNGSDVTISLAAALVGLPEDQRAEWMLSGKLLTGIIVDDPATTADAGIDVSDGVDDAGNPIPISHDPLFHRGQTKVVAWVADPWFDAWRHVAGRTEKFSSATLVRAGTSSDEKEQLLPIDPRTMTYNASRGRWEVTYALPQVSTTDSRPVEGMYTVDLAYQGLTGSANNPECDPMPVTFGVDYTGPALGRLELSERSPMQYGWIFSRGTEDISVGVSDNLSGIQQDSGVVHPSGNLTTDDLPVTYTASDGLARSLAGTLSFAFGEDAQRLTFSGTTIAVQDRAGNKTTSAPIASWNGAGGTNIPEGATGVSIDTVAPTIDVSFDNNDVRNEKYYAATRTATITLTESNFDIARANDEHNELVIAHIGRDGNQIARICARDFENPSGDGKTWVSTYTFEDDADWTLDVAYTDLAGREAQAYSTAFVVDTQAPSIMVTWDNNDVANGMYYKAPRTATIEVNDRNFSPSLASVETTAADASGAGVVAPGASAWSELEPRQKWGCSASFGSELHYTMKVTATDLAGNVADTYEEPEFVIDMTAPVVTISDVSDHTAYSDVIAPTISYSDTNFDPTFTTYILTGGRSGSNAYVNGIQDANDTTTRTVSFPDFAHTLEMDDVYTLDAQMTDLAGNEAQQAVTFSVNRYGSTYILTDTSGNILGSYLNRPQDVVVHEINPSGLDQSASHAEVVHDSEVAALAAGSDYQIGAGMDADTWSDTTYTFPAHLFEEDGYYRILLTSLDLAGNLSQNTMDAKNAQRDGTAEIAFAIDSTAPSADLIGVKSNGVYLDPQKTALVSTGDNLAVAHAEVLVDGEEIAAWDNPSDEGTEVPSVSLEADGRPHRVELAVTDCAGNQSRVTYDGVVVTGDLLTFVLNTPRLLFGSVAGLIVVAAVIALSAALAVRHHKLTKDKNNPFGHTAKSKR